MFLHVRDPTTGIQTARFRCTGSLIAEPKALDIIDDVILLLSISAMLTEHPSHRTKERKWESLPSDALSVFVEHLVGHQGMHSRVQSKRDDTIALFKTFVRSVTADILACKHDTIKFNAVYSLYTYLMESPQLQHLRIGMVYRQWIEEHEEYQYDFELHTANRAVTVGSPVRLEKWLRHQAHTHNTHDPLFLFPRFFHSTT